MENFDSNFDFAVCDACNDAMTPQEVSEKIADIIKEKYNFETCVDEFDLPEQFDDPDESECVYGRDIFCNTEEVMDERAPHYHEKDWVTFYVDKLDNGEESIYLIRWELC